jgi:hypothetical protein
MQRGAGMSATSEKARLPIKSSFSGLFETSEKKESPLRAGFFYPSYFILHPFQSIVAGLKTAVY